MAEAKLSKGVHQCGGGSDRVRGRRYDGCEGRWCDEKVSCFSSLEEDGNTGGVRVASSVLPSSTVGGASRRRWRAGGGSFERSDPGPPGLRRCERLCPVDWSRAPQGAFSL